MDVYKIGYSCCHGVELSLFQQSRDRLNFVVGASTHIPTIYLRIKKLGEKYSLTKVRIIIKIIINLFTHI